MANTKKNETTKVVETKEVTEKKVAKVRIDEREAEWMKAFKDAGYDVSIDKKHINLRIKGVGMHIAIQKNSLVPYITFSSDEQLEGLEKIFAVKKYGYTVQMPAKQSEKGDSRFRAVGKRTQDEIDLALEIVKKVVELKEKTTPKKEEKKPAEKKAVAKKSEKKATPKKAPAKKAASKKPAESK